MLEQLLVFISEKLNTGIEKFANYLPNIIIAFFILSLFAFLAKILKKSIRAFVSRFIRKRSLQRFVTLFLQLALITLGILISLSILDLGKAVTSILTGAGVAGLVIGFALQEIISNYFSGFTISVSDPFGRGDLVKIGDQIGNIRRIKSRTTLLQTPTGQLVEMPNQVVINNPIINYTSTGKRRIDIESGISYSSDKKKAKELAIQVVKENEKVNKSESIEFFYTKFGKSSLNFVLRFWMDFENSQSDYYQLRSEIITELLDIYDKNNIVMPYPIQIVKVENKQ